jgi:hypothetical protein
MVLCGGELGRMLDEIKWFIEDYLEQIGSIILIIVVVVGSFFLISEMSKDPDALAVNSEEQLQYMETTSNELKETFSILQEMNQGSEEYPVMIIDLYLKKPYINSSDLRMILEQYVKVEKNKLNSDDVQVRAIRFRIYDRKIVWEKGLTSKGIYEYRLSTDENPKTKTIKSDETAIGGNATGIEERSIQEIAWDNTILNQKKKPDYDKYELDGEFLEVTKTNKSEPLTDQEFEWFLKYDIYQTLGDGPRLYLAWELGVEPTEKDMRSIQKQFDTFVKRLSNMNDYTSYYSNNEAKLKKQLVIENPQLLYYATTGKVVEDEYESRRLLVVLDPDLYKETVNEWVAEQASKVVEENSKEETSEESEDTEILIDSSYDSIIESTEESSITE